jgi:hypothetical protein
MSKRESEVQEQCREAASNGGWRLWRNNVGAAETTDGRHIRYGLCNESKKMNRKLKSSDLIGIRPIHITQEMVGTVIGQFVAVECKKEAWGYTDTPREKAQLAFLNLVTRLGGYAEFNNTGEFGS